MRLGEEAAKRNSEEAALPHSQSPRLPISASLTLPFAVAPQLDHVIANLELMPLRMDIGSQMDRLPSHFGKLSQPQKGVPVCRLVCRCILPPHFGQQGVVSVEDTAGIS